MKKKVKRSRNHQNKTHKVECYEEVKNSCNHKNRLTFGIGGDFGFGINSGEDFRVNPVTIVPAIECTDNGKPDADCKTQGQIIPAITTAQFIFNKKFDNMYGANISLGGMIIPNVELSLELAYNQLSIHDADNHPSKLDLDTLRGLVNLTYYLGLQHASITPYISAGIGLVRDKLNGTLYDNADISAETTSKISFGDAVHTGFGYQLGLGLVKSINCNTMFGIGYKLIGVSRIEGHDVSPDVTVTQGLNKINTKSLPFSIGNTNAHNITAFLKFMM